MSEEKRIRWLCRRGMKELDVLLDRFVRAEYAGLSSAEHEALVSLLEEEDPDLWYLVMGRATTDDPVKESLLARIRVHEANRR